MSCGSRVRSEGNTASAFRPACIVVAQIHVPQGVCNLLIHFGLRVEVEQRGDDLAVDLAAVVVAGKGRADGRGHRAAGGVVGQLAGHVGRGLPFGSSRAPAHRR